MPLLTLLRVNVPLRSAVRYERATRRLAEKAKESGNTFEWTARSSNGIEGLSYGFLARAESYAELVTREQVPDLARRLLGESAGDDWLEFVGNCVESTSFTVAQPREDLSTAPQRSDPAPLSLVARIKVRPGGQRAFETLVARVNEAAIKIDEPRQIYVSQTAIGDLTQYGVVTPVDDPAALDKRRSPQEVLVAAFGEKEAEEIFQPASEQIQEIVTSLSQYRPELSNRA